MKPTPSKLFWGKHFWFVIHFVSLTLSLSDFFQLLTLLTALLPCWECREHLSENIETLRGDPSAKTSFSVSYRLHSLVNRLTGVQLQPSEVAVKSFYSRKGGATFDQELIFVIRAICFKFDHHKSELKKFLGLVAPLASYDLQQILHTYPLATEYETQADLFFWSYRLGEVYQSRKGGVYESWTKFSKEFSEGMSDDCDQCSLR